jgi:pimeloyl-ACP methyl ester carboxylesterase
MKRVYIIVISLVAAYLLFCAGCMRFRISDAKAKKVFQENNTTLSLYDTVIQGHQVHDAISGKKDLPLLVFVHGSPGSWSNYAAYMYDKDLLEKFQMMSIDRPGFGFSEFGEPMHLKEQAELLLYVVAAHPTAHPVFLAGHSIGGPIVAQMAAMSPGSFQKIVILSGSISPYLEEKETWRNILDNAVLRKFLPGAFAPSNTEIRWFKQDLYELEKELPAITTDVIFIHGDRDSWVPIENVAFGIQKMTHAKSVRSDTLQGAGHLLPFKHFTAVKQALLRLY